MQISEIYETVLAELNTHSLVYEDLPFNTGYFLLITNYKLIGNYRQVLKRLKSGDCDQNCLEEFASGRELLYEEMLFQMDKALLLTSLTEKEVEQLHRFNALHKTLLSETGNITPELKILKHTTMNHLLMPENLAILIEEIKQLPVTEPAVLLEKIKSISDALAGQDFKIARHLHELQISLFTGEDQNAGNFTDIRKKLVYLLEQIGKL